MKIIELEHSSGKYNIYVGQGILRRAFDMALANKDYDRVFLVTDSNVNALWGEPVKAELSACGCVLAGGFVFNAGEKSKTLSTVADIYAAFCEAELTRRSLVIALGGGVCGDMAGFAAATYLRGIDVMQVPTTLLAQIDSSIGGKTGVDTPIGKNLVGAIKQPMAVIADSRFLDTLEKRYLTDAMAEAIKYGCIADEQLFCDLQDKNIELAQMIYRCMKIKADVVSKDEFETGVREILNYGHTFGHAVEKLGGFERFSHGEAVGIGMLYAARIGAALGFDGMLEEKIRSSLEVWGLPTVMDYSTADLIEVIRSDKKRTGDEIKFVLLDKLGHAQVKKLEITKLGEMI